MSTWKMRYAGADNAQQVKLKVLGHDCLVHMCNIVAVNTWVNLKTIKNKNYSLLICTFHTEFQQLGLVVLRNLLGDTQSFKLK